MRKLEEYEKSQSGTTDCPFGLLRNETVSGNNDGTEIVAEQMQDLYYSLYQILQLAGVQPNGKLENGNSSKQFLNSLSNIAPLIYNSTTTYKNNVIVLQIANNEVNIYKSKSDNNKAVLSDTSKWVLLTKINASGVFSNITLNSPNMTGTPTVPTASSGTNNTQAASTAFVKNSLSGLVKFADLAPDYSKGVNAPNNYVATSNGWLLCTARLDSYQSHVRINGISVFGIEPQWLKDWSGWKLYGMFIIEKGQKVTLDGNATATFYPCRNS